MDLLATNSKASPDIQTAICLLIFLPTHSASDLVEEKVSIIMYLNLSSASNIAGKKYSSADLHAERRQSVRNATPRARSILGPQK
ncbi:uncharacterized protein EI90DRAFT_1111753 [Cantharellus anzutake]|uniref:uncharacterized protein n=1 Tax=Cantharellus anzutake TaxID=1750568 RepID=UPI00190376A0|nr:uncharacterized protein EI90DRAFT_1111753 [Cantharellus anzutake]KAF8330922.1 hypothetical protein EI90DRAFT_1111753 [Cantharellus anzutake]